MLSVIPPFENPGLRLPESCLSPQSFPGVVCAASKLGNIWRDKPRIGSCPPDGKCGEDLGKDQSFQDQELLRRSKECPSMGFFSGFCIMGSNLIVEIIILTLNARLSITSNCLGNRAFQAGILQNAMMASLSHSRTHTRTHTRDLYSYLQVLEF